jgi:class 3 adenylate cyclase
MECPKCKTENEDSRVCPKCGFENRAGDKFCGECGVDLRTSLLSAPKELTAEIKLAKIKRYLPKDLTEKILAQKNKIEGEKKIVTVMFCDMERFTTLSEQIGPENAYSIMDQVYEILIQKVHDYEGTVNEMTGDGIMAIFGAPIALEDAPQRAVRSACAIHRELSVLNAKLRRERSNSVVIKMRVGMHTGGVVVGSLGSDLRVEFKAVGDTVNLASRMEGLAQPGTTYVTEDTFKLTEGMFRYESLGERSVKGRGDSTEQQQDEV